MATVVATQSPLVIKAPERLLQTGTIQRRHDVPTSINYYKDPGDGSLPLPIRIADNTVTNKRPTVAQQVVVRDITGEEDKYTLDSHGFQFHRHESKATDFHDPERVEAEYYPEAVQLLKDVTGASRVFIFDHKTRCGPSDWHKLGKGNRGSRGPLLRAHVDQSYAGAELVLRRHFPDEADELVKRRYQIINIWRPLRPILKDPLAVADATSIPDGDLVAASIEYPADRDETWAIRPGASHRWYFKYAQRPDEVMLIKCFDSLRAGDGDGAVPARRAPHSAFEDPDHLRADHRQSIEARALVFYDQ
ncbi:hypothetical protein F4779DRAFT_573955 [Xylariaceae sp. FL0662B]|nr:hypothetical protein F4779DRAFT_573955 [Xylariaceae sp. FL0662B]